jgi:hypothetical protein
VIDILKEMTSNIISGNDRCKIKNRKENQFVYCCTQRWEWVDFMMILMLGMEKHNDAQLENALAQKPGGQLDYYLKLQIKISY